MHSCYCVCMPISYLNVVLIIGSLRSWAHATTVATQIVNVLRPNKCRLTHYYYTVYCGKAPLSRQGANIVHISVLTEAPNSLSHCRVVALHCCNISYLPSSGSCEEPARQELCCLLPAALHSSGCQLIYSNSPKLGGALR